MNFFDNLITHERDLSFGLQSSLDIHNPAFTFSHLAGGTVPSSGWHDTLRRYRWEALLAQELPRSRQLRLERHDVTTPVTISVLLSVHCSLSPPTDHSGGDKKSLSLYMERIPAGGIYKPPWCENYLHIMHYIGEFGYMKNQRLVAR